MLEQAADATTADNQDIWLVLAQPPLVQVVLFQALVVDWVLLVVGMVVDLLLVVDLPADLVQLLATSAEDQTISLEIAKLKP